MEPNKVARDTAALTVASIVSGVLAYVFFALTTQTLGAAAAAGVSVLWTYWSAAGAALTFPIQHWIIRQLQAEGSETGVARALPRLWLAILGIAAAAGAVAWLLRGSLFRQPGVAFPLMVAGVTLGAGFFGIVRGGLAGRQRFVATAGVILFENAVRVAGALVVAALGVGAAGFGAALLAGPLVGAAVPSAWRFDRGDAAGGAASPFRILGEIAGGSLLAQIVLTAGPVALALVGGSPAEVTSLFAALALFRAPYVLALGLLTQLTGALTRFVVEGRVGAMRRVRMFTLTGTTVAAGVGAAIGWWVAAPVLTAIFGEGVTLPAGALAVVGLATALGLGGLVLTLTLLARGRSNAALYAWTGALAAATVWIVAGPGAPLSRVVGGFLIAQLLAFAAMVVVESREISGQAPAPAASVQRP